MTLALLAMTNPTLILDSTTIQLPWPPSTNNAYATVKGRRVKTETAREYAREVAWVCATKTHTRLLRDRLAGTKPRLSVRIDAHPPDRRRRDLANLEKLVIDALFAWLDQDDSQIDELHLVRQPPIKHGELQVTIREA